MEKPARARVWGCEKPRDLQRSAEKAGATEGIQSAEEGGSPLKSAREAQEGGSHRGREGGSPLKLVGPWRQLWHTLG